MNMDVCVCCCVMDKDGKGTKVMCGGLVSLHIIMRYDCMYYYALSDLSRSVMIFTGYLLCQSVATKRRINSVQCFCYNLLTTIFLVLLIISTNLAQDGVLVQNKMRMQRE